MPYRSPCEATLCGRLLTYTPAQDAAALYAAAFSRAYTAQQARPYAFPQRLFDCGLYIVFTLGAMLHCNEFTPLRVYTIFRAQHNGFYGKNRPF